MMSSDTYMRFVLLLGLVALLSGCGESDGLDPLPIPEGCNPLAADWDCLLPYPSDFFLVEDPALPSGRRIALSGKAVITTDEKEYPADPSSVHPADGFSHINQILALFPSGVDTSNLVFHTGDVLASLQLDSPTLLVEAESRETVLHFAETDPRADSDDRRALLIRPLVRLRNATRYIVAIHDLRSPGGDPVEPPEGFRRIRDGQAEGHDVLGPLAVRYEEEIFPVLQDLGVERAGLQLAWDFTTQTQQHVTADMLAVREQVIARFTDQPPQVTITGLTDEVNEYIFRRVEGFIRVPLFMESPEAGARLYRDASGKVVANGETEVPFTVLIPRSVAGRQPDDPPARLLQYGHGFFGSRDNESEMSHVYEFFDRLQLVSVAVDWWGMATEDSFVAVEAILSRPSEIMVFTDRLHQGMANFISMAYAAKGPLLQQPQMQLGPQPTYDPEQVYFYGLSQGHILGGTYVALSPHVQRATLGAGGAGLTFIMFRSHSFAPFLGFIDMVIHDPLDVQKYVASTQTTFDRVDPITYAPHLLTDTYPGGPSSRRLLMHAGIGDPTMPTMAAHLHARALGLGHLQPAPREIPALDEVQAPHDGSALVEFDFGIDPLPGIEATPPEEDNVVHDGVRELDAAIRQIDLFFRPGGLIENTCDGICDPE